MTSWGSQQWRLFRRARRDGATIEEAALIGGQSPEEARLLDEIDQRNSPLPMEAFDLLYDPAARAAAATEKEDHMAEEEDQVEEVASMDVERFKRLYFGDIKPAKSEAASQNQTIGEAYKVIKKECKIRPDAAKMAIKVFEMEEVHGEDFFRSFVAATNELFNREVLTYHSFDLVDQAQSLATLMDDEDMPDFSEVEFEEADEDELATQLSRPSTEAAKAAEDAAKEDAEAKPKRTRRTARPKDETPPPGTGASAIKSMNEASSTVQ